MPYSKPPSPPPPPRINIYTDNVRSQFDYYCLSGLHAGDEYQACSRRNRNIVTIARTFLCRFFCIVIDFKKRFCHRIAIPSEQSKPNRFCECSEKSVTLKNENYFIALCTLCLQHSRIHRIWDDEMLCTLHTIIKSSVNNATSEQVIRIRSWLEHTSL